jgi:hypothetical protein
VPTVRVAVGLLIDAIGATTLGWLLLNGSKPVHFTTPE